MRTMTHLIFCLLFQVPLIAAAQDQHPLLEEENRYQFTAPDTIDPAIAKSMLGAITDLEPRMHINIDHADHLIKVLAYQPIDPEAVVAIAAQFGVTLINRRAGIPTEAVPTTE